MTPQHKPGSKASRDALRQEMTATGCRTAEIAVEMRARWRMRPREAWRHSLGWTLQEAADRLNALGTERPGEAVAADASLLGKWEKWPGPSERRPTLAVLVLLAQLYGCDVEDLLDLDDLRELPANDLRVLRHTASVAQPRKNETTKAPSAEVPPTGVELVRSAAAESAAWAQWAEVSNVGDIALEQLMADARSLAADYLTDEPMDLFRRTRVLRDRVFALLEGHQHPRQSADLYVAAGYLCGLLAWMSSDLGQLREADTQGRTAWLCADLAGHNDLRAWALSTRSKIPFWDGRLKDAVTHARHGASYHPGGTVGVLLACQEADAWSMIGARAEAQQALDQADTARDRVTGTDDIGGLFSCPELRRANYASSVHLRTGDPARALNEAHEALVNEPFHAYGTTAQMHISEAAAHIALRCPDGAAEALRPVLALPPERRMTPVTTRMRELSETIARSTMVDSSTAIALREEIQGFVTESAPRRVALSSREAGPDWIQGHGH
ncbi:XRE family transcriptional regulator [Streptomyces sp. RPT161]|uniref:XRE family transcriptional regulator n=1 Tax=Streptomyces sp. RPT161 TaxID=3015993 RepID=UPI0022B8E78A|nr:XRE family transcriptional regulator [Streptomyces sp. RPT161]